MDLSGITAPIAAGLTCRWATEADHARVLAVLDRWWGRLGGVEGAQQRVALLPRLFFQHFADTSLVVERDGQMVAFLVGLLSQSRPDEAYIHFIGVAPEFQRHGLGRHLYDRFFELARWHGRNVVRAITSVTNTQSQAFHLRMGFTTEPSPHQVDGRPAHRDYDGPGLDRVTFIRHLRD